MSCSNCCFLTCIQISQKAGKVVWYFHLLKNFPQFVVIHTVKGFAIVNKVEADIFLELSCFFCDPMDVGNLISGSSVIQLEYLEVLSLLTVEASLGEFWALLCYNCAVVWTFFGIAFLWEWNENWLFPVLWLLLSFPICWHIECSTFRASSFRTWNSSTGISSYPLALFVVMLCKAHLTLHSRVSDFRWLITPSLSYKSLRSFLYHSSIFLPPFLNVFCFY